MQWRKNRGKTPFVLLVKDSSADYAIWQVFQTQRRLAILEADTRKLNLEDYLALKCHLLPNSNHCSIKHNQMTDNEISSRFHDHSSEFDLLFNGMENLASPDVSCKLISGHNMIVCPMELILFGPPAMINLGYCSDFEKKTSLLYLHHKFCQLTKEC